MTLLTFFPLALDGTEAVSVIRFRHPASTLRQRSARDFSSPPSSTEPLSSAV